MGLLATILSSTALTAALAWLFRQWISVTLTAAVKHEFDLKLEETKSEFRVKEEGLKAELRAKGSQLEALQSAVVTQLSTRQSTACQRQFEAIESIWDAVIQIAPQKMAAKMMQSVNFDFAVEHAPTDSRIREMFAYIRKTFNLNANEQRSPNISRARLYVSPLTWSLYVAYSTILWFAVTKISMLESGTNALEMFKTKEIIDMVKVALPHQSEFIKKYGLSSLDFLVDELETALFQSLRKEINGAEDDVNAAQKAAAILDHISKATQS
ncbi:MAG: hypothetical protein WCF59_00040 [Desulfobaccales bacterium]